MTVAVRKPLREMSDEEIIVASQSGDKRARQVFLVNNLPLVKFIAKSFDGCGLDREDLVQEGSIGLMKALDLFDLDRGNKFSTYAYRWIRKFMMDAIHSGAKNVRIPRHTYWNRVTYNRAIEDTSSRREAINSLGWSRSKLQLIENIPICSSTDDITYLPQNESNPEDELVSKEDNQLLSDAIKLLDDYERELIEKRYGLNGREYMSLVKVSAEEGPSPETIRKRQLKIEQKIRSFMEEGSPNNKEVL